MISIIIPTYNRIKTLRRCIESILRQHFSLLEIIIIDDGSMDGTKEYLQQLSKEYSFIRVIINENNKGVNYSRNRGIEEAKNKFILFLDSDDHLRSDGLINIQSVINDHPQIKHFLFLVSDRSDELNSMHEVKSIKYEDWLKGSVYGDFTHVIETSIMKNNLFFEQFRIYEYLNWIRVKKLSEPQLFVPIIAVERERNRKDSLTNSSRLNNYEVIRSKFESKKLYYHLYHADLNYYHSKSLGLPLFETILLGIACNCKSDSKQLIQYISNRYIRFILPIFLLLPSFAVKTAILKYSEFKASSN